MTSRLQARLLAQRALFQRLQSSKKRNKTQSGFTLIELLIVIVIIGILAAIAIPSFLAQRNRGYEANARSFVSAQARKCGAALVVGVEGDYTVPATEPDMGTSGITLTYPAAGACSSAATFSVAGGPSGTITWTVDSAGGVSQAIN